MKIEFDRNTCIGMFQCVYEWESFQRDEDARKAVLDGASEDDDGIFSLAVPADEQFDAKMAARVCPVDAITLYDDDGEQLIP